MNGTQDTAETTMTSNETQVDNLKNQLESIRQELETAKTLSQNMQQEFNPINEKLQKLQAIPQMIEDIRNKVNEKSAELQSYKSRKFNPNHLASIGIGLFVSLLTFSVVFSIFILNSNLGWEKICGILGLFLLCVVFASVGMRLMSDRCK